MAITLVNHVSAEGGQNSTTTGAANFLTSALLALVMSWYDAATEPTVSDSSSNTWTPGTAYHYPGDNRWIRMYYVASPTVSSSQTFSATGTNGYAPIAVVGFAGTALSSPLDAENGASTFGASLNTGSVTPSTNGQVLITGCANSGTIATIGSSFNLVENQSKAATYGLALAYKIQTTAGAENPLWTPTASVALLADIATFKAASGGGGTNAPAESKVQQQAVNRASRWHHRFPDPAARYLRERERERQKFLRRVARAA